MLHYNILNILYILIVKLRLGSGTQAQSGSNSGSVTQAQWLRLSDRDSEPRLTLKSLRPPPPTTTHYPPITFKHDGSVSHINPKSKTDLEWSPQPIQHKKFQVDDDREYMGQSNMSKENIINLSSFNQYSILSSSGSLWLSLWLSLALSGSLWLSLLHSLTPKLNLT